jgi:hypothetical protein
MTASDAHPARCPLPEVIGYRAPVAPTAFSQGYRAEEGLSSSRHHHLDVPSPLRRGVLRGCFQGLHRFRGLRREVRGSALPLRFNDAAGFASCYGPPSCSPYRAFDTGLRRRAFPPDAASLLPGLLTATRTGLTPAGDDELAIEGSATTSTSPPIYWTHTPGSRSPPPRHRRYSRRQRRGHLG